MRVQPQNGAMFLKHGGTIVHEKFGFFSKNPDPPKDLGII